MTDRRLTVTKLSEGKFVLRGVAYEADKPNINGLIYPKHVLEKALTKYMAKPDTAKLLTIGCCVEPKLKDVIGFVTDGEIVENELRITARTISDSVIANVAAVYSQGLAFVGSGIGETYEQEDVLCVRKFEITGIGVVRLSDVEESSDSD